MIIEISIANERITALGTADVCLVEVGDAGNIIDEGGRVRRSAGCGGGELGSLHAEVQVANMVFQFDLGGKLLAAALLVGPSLELGTCEVDLATYVAETLVGSAEVIGAVGFGGEFLPASRMGTGVRLAVLGCLSGMVELDVPLELA